MLLQCPVNFKNKCLASKPLSCWVFENKQECTWRQKLLYNTLDNHILVIIINFSLHAPVENQKVHYFKSQFNLKVHISS